MRKTIILGIILIISLNYVNAATLTCRQITDASIEIPQFSSQTIEIQCTASGGTVSNIQITPNADPGTGLSIVSSQAMPSQLDDQETGSAKWTLTGDSPNTYTITYQITSDGNEAWDGADTTIVNVPGTAQLTVEYVLPPSIFTPSVTHLDVKITNIGGTTANNVILQLNNNSKISYPTSIEAGAVASYSWTNETGFNHSGTYTTRVFIGDAEQDSATVTVVTGAEARELYAGYNLISLKKIPENATTTAVLRSIAGKYSKLWRYNNTKQNFEAFDPVAGLSFSKIKTMDIRTGYWIKMKNLTAYLNESGSDPGTVSINLGVGYNLIGFPSKTQRNVSSVMSSIAGKYEKIWKWDSAHATFKAYDPGIPAEFNSDFGNMTPGQGYWIKMKEAAVLTITN